jgi:hypothetical protein
MRVVKRCRTLEEAHLERARLAEAGIEADVLDETIATTAPYLLASAGIRLAVADEEADQACDLLGVPRAATVEPPKRGGLPAWIALVVGVAAVTVVIAGMKQTRGSAQATKMDLDRNGDGKADARSIFDTKGRATESFEDNNFDGKWDVRFVMHENIVITAEQDLDFDGAFDSQSRFKNGVLMEQTVIPSGSGNPLFRHEYKNGVAVASWFDPERDGKWNERIEYDPMGRETARVPMK